MTPGVDKLKKSLIETGRYVTPDRVRMRFADRIFGRFSFWLHFLLLRVVARGCGETRHGGPDRLCWAEHAVRSIWAVERCGGQVLIEGEPLTRIQGPAVYVANHMSMLETLIMPGPILAFNDATIVVKQALLDMRFFGAVMRNVGALGVGRKDPRQDLKVMLEGGTAEIRKGRSIMLFPQSTRLPVFDGSKFNSIGVKLAVKAGVPVVPIALKTDMLGIGKVLRDFGKVDRSKKVLFRFGEPLPCALGKREMHEKCVSFITETLREWGAEVVEPEKKGSGGNADEQ